MTTKALIVPVAAMTVMAGNAYAFNSQSLSRARLSDDQIAAFEAAHDLRADGNYLAARDVLEDAGIDMQVLREIKNSWREQQWGMNEDALLALEKDDYEGFVLAIKGTELADVIKNKESFDTYVEAYELGQAGKHEEARLLLESLGLEADGRGHGQGYGRYGTGDDQ